MKKYFTLFLLALLPLVSNAYDAEIDGIYYNFISEIEAEVTFGDENDYDDQGNTFYLGNVVIPASVTYNEKTYTITSIGEGAFNCCSSLTSVTIPNSVTSIGEYAFEGCIGLKEVTIGSGVKSIGNDSFETCTNITTLYINCEDIPAYLFADSHGKLQTLTLGDNVKTIGAYAFEDCSGLTSLTIPGSVISIDKYAFYNCGGLTSVIIGSGVASIRELAFALCRKLTDVYCLTENVPESDYNMFYRVPLSDATLYVPESAIKRYNETKPWSGFGRLVSLTQDMIDGIREGESGELKVDGSVYNLAGQKMVNAQSSMVNAKLPRGISIIRYSDGTTRKVATK